MQRVALAGADGLEVSRFVFGTGSLHHVSTRKAQSGLLSTAIDGGFTHFDTAPYYGFGLAESVLGEVLAANRHITVTTKVGLYPPSGATSSHAMVLFRKALGRIWKPLSRGVVDWHVEKARRSLENSLRRLRRDRIDLLLMHEPVTELIDCDEWQRFLQDETRAGRVRAFGVAGIRYNVEPLVRSGCPLAGIVQTEDDLTARTADFLLEAGRPLQLTFGYVSSAPPGAHAVEILSRALQRNATGAVVVSTRSAERIGQYAEICRHSVSHC